LGREKITRVLLVNPSLGTTKFSREDLFRSYLSLGTLASALGDRSFLETFARRSPAFRGRPAEFPNFEIKVANLSSRPERQSVQQYLRAFMEEIPALVGVTATSAQLDEVRDVADAAKRIAPDALRVIGGPHVSVSPEEFLRDSEFQAACIGEGVETLTELAMSFPAVGAAVLPEVTGIAHKDAGGRVHRNASREFLFRLDEHPFPSESLGLFAVDLSDRDRNARELVYLLAGCGCPHRCSFCAQHAIHGGRVRERSAENIFAEMIKLQSLGFRRFAVVQETFFSNSARVERFCDLIERSGTPFEWTAEARADQLTFELLKRMGQAGLRFIQIGLESGDEVLLKGLGKGISLDQVRRVRDWCEVLKIDTAFYLLVGLPGQGWQSILKSALFLRNHTPYNRITRHISVSVAIPYPGTKIAEEGSVRLVGREPSSLSWPGRNCKADVNEDGVLVGRNFTETDAMTSREILEAYTYLDDLGDFLLHAKYDPAYSPEERVRALDFAGRILAMIERRTLRDLIARAQEDLTPEMYKKAHAEILEKDGEEESSLRNVGGDREPGSATLTNFLARVRFGNGCYGIMKRFSILDRIKWMKICALAWGLAGSTCELMRFEQEGEEYERLLEGVPAPILNQMLGMLDGGFKAEEITPDIFRVGKEIRMFGFRFTLHSEGLIKISLG
jgi:anaerobic magnesium-protoporphyrin IX monomethyl ester cyclase